MMKAKEVKIEAAYMGRRLLAKGGCGYMWLIDGKPAVYRKQIAPATIGEVWTLTKREDSVLMGGEHRPVATGRRHPVRKDIVEWEALSAVHKQEQLEEQASKRLAKRQTEVERLCEPLATVYRTLRTSTERQCFIRAVVTLIGAYE